MNSRPISRRLGISALVLCLSVAAGLTGCSSAGTRSATGEKLTVRIAYQHIPNGDLIVKDKGWLEAALPDATIQWVKFDSGGDVNTAILGKAIDLGLIGSSPATKGLSAPLNIPYKILWVHDLIGENEALVARPGITEVKGLVGKKVATPFSSTAHYSLLAALADAGVDPAKVTIVDLEPPNILASYTRGDVDAAYVWTPTLSELQKAGTVLVTSRQLADRGKLTADVGVVTNAFSAEHPEVVDAWLKAEDRAVKLVKERPDEAAQSVARQLSITPQLAADQLKLVVVLDAAEQAGPKYLGTPASPGALAENLHNAAEFLSAQKKIDAVPDLKVFQGGLATEALARVVRR